MSSSGPERTDRLVLVGTVHQESAGMAKLQSLLAALRPGMISLEMSPYALEYRLRRAPHLLRRLEVLLAGLAADSARPLELLAAHPAVAGIRELLALPFEYRAASEYAGMAGAALELIDLSEISAAKLRRVEEELVTAENLRVLIDLPPPSSAVEGTTAARALVLEARGEAIRQAFLAGRRGEEGIGRRDRHMADQIRRLLACCPAHLVHIGGWVHLVADREGETLYSRLADLNPRRVFLEA